MNDKNANELKEKKSDLTKEIIQAKELPKNRFNKEQKNFPKYKSRHNNFYFWDLSGGFLGI